jgi:hypothetical protein
MRACIVFEIPRSSPACEHSTAVTSHDGAPSNHNAEHVIEFVCVAISLARKTSHSLQAFLAGHSACHKHYNFGIML